MSASIVYLDTFDNVYVLIVQYNIIQTDRNLDLCSQHHNPCLLYTSDAADDLLCVDLGGRRIIKKKNKI